MTPARRGLLTYLTWTLFVFPSLGLWLLGGVFVVPKLQQISVDAGLMNDASFWPFLHSAIRLNLFATHNLAALLMIGVAGLAALEWWSVGWRRFRGPVVGGAVFLLNSVVLLSFFIMMIGLALAAPGLRNGMH